MHDRKSTTAAGGIATVLIAHPGGIETEAIISNAKKDRPAFESEVNLHGSWTPMLHGVEQSLGQDRHDASGYPPRDAFLRSANPEQNGNVRMLLPEVLNSAPHLTQEAK